MELLDMLVGYDKAIIVDAIQTEAGRPGQIYRLDPRVLDITRHVSSLHDVNFATALELGRRLGLALPREIIIYAIEAADVTSFSEECTPELKMAVPACVEMIARELEADRPVCQCPTTP
ncbi:MAG: hydrogenase maturation protease [Chloroflexota bacterium]